MQFRLSKLTSTVAFAALACLCAAPSLAEPIDPETRQAVSRGLDWLAHQQHQLGSWTAQGRYPTAMTSLAGLAMLCEGSTTTQGKYAENIRRAVDFLTRRARPNGLIGDQDDDRYTYGHGFAMLFLSEVLGEEEDVERQQELIRILAKAVEFTGYAQTKDGGWGYVSAKDGGGFDEGSTTITQVQGLRSCRNAGVPVPKEIIDKAVKYIHGCTLKDGAVQYSSKGGGGRPAITAAAVACLFNAGEYDDDYVPRMLEYCRANLDPTASDSFGHWHYAHFYYAQVQYREGGDVWEQYRRAIRKRLLTEATETKVADETVVFWQQGYVGPVYTTALNLIMLQLDNACLPIYQR
ncbi:MAG: terpene cyclase/mutase family protein [Pirellulales bacterium]|nr:terpene cyclase/mutase family protein [Pirellulales bacterium]